MLSSLILKKEKGKGSFEKLKLIMANFSDWEFKTSQLCHNSNFEKYVISQMYVI